MPFHPPGDLPNPGIEPRTPALQAESLSSEPIRKRNRAHFGRIQMDQWYQPKCTSLNNQSPHWGMWASIRSLFPTVVTESKSVIFAKEKRKNILRVSSWEFPWDLAVGILSFHFHDQSSIPGQGTDPERYESWTKKKKKKIALTKMSFFSSLEIIICNCMVMDLNYTCGNHFVMYANNKYYVTHLKLVYVKYT